MNDRPKNQIAAQALKALRLRRQWESGDLTQQEYLARLEVIERVPDRAAERAPRMAAKAVRVAPSDDSTPITSDQPARLIGALELLRLRRRLESGHLTRQEYLSQLQAAPEEAAVAEPESAPVPAPRPLPARAPIAVSPVKVVATASAVKVVSAASVGSVVAAASAIAPAPAIPASPAPAAPKKSAARQPSAGAMEFWLEWRRRPRKLRLLAAGGAAFVLIAGLQALASREFRASARKSAVPNTALAGDEYRPVDLVVSEAGFAGPKERRRIAGIVKNQSVLTYTDVQLTFSLVGPNGDTVGLATATIGRIGGRETAKFEAPSVKPKAVELVLQHIESHRPWDAAP